MSGRSVNLTTLFLGRLSMLPDRVSNPGPLTYESGAQPIALRGPAQPSVISILQLAFNKINIIVISILQLAFNNINIMR